MTRSIEQLDTDLGAIEARFAGAREVPALPEVVNPDDADEFLLRHQSTQSSKITAQNFRRYAAGVRVVARASGFTVDAPADFLTFFDVDASAGPVPVTLPAPTPAIDRFTVVIGKNKVDDSGNPIPVTVAGAGSPIVELTLASSWVRFICDGARWVAYPNTLGELTSVDVVARDRAALNAIRLMASTSITTGEHVQGYLWKLETDEWGASSADEAYVVTAGLNFYANLPERLINPTAEATAVTPSGTLQVNRPVSELFDGLTTFDVLGGGGASTTTNVLIQWPAARAISRARAFLGIDPLNGNRGRADLYGSQDNVNFTLIGSTGNIGPFTGFLDINLTDTTTSYNFHTVQIVSTTDGVRIRELELYEDAGGGDMTLASPSLPAAAQPADPPDLVTAYFLYRDASGGAQLGTDLTVRGSRDGVTFIPGAPEVLAAYDGDWSFVKASFDLTGQPAGVDPTIEIATVGGREQRIAAPTLFWG